MKNILVLFSLITLLACQNEEATKVVTTINIQLLETPCKEGATPNLVTNQSGQTYLSWIEYLDDTTDQLVFAKLEKDGWSAPKVIATGSDWFVNWADFPSLVVSNDNDKHLAAHWLQKSAGGTYDYDVRIAQSMDGGESWSASFIPHTDGIAAEHGFVSMLPIAEDRFFATWLDGRHTKTVSTPSTQHDHDHGQGGAMSLRTAVFDAEGNLYQEAELDHRICDCCQTGAAMSEQGPIVVYRDRSEEEIRDISLVRKVNGNWTEPMTIGKDNWKIAGCPVNGPSIATAASTVAVAWYTAAQDTAKVQVVFSEDNGANFSQPIRIDAGEPLGRVDVVLWDEQTAIVSWLEKVNEKAAICIAKVTAKGEVQLSETITITNPTRQSGFPRLIKSGDRLILAWTDVGETTHVQSAIVTFS